MGKKCEGGGFNWTVPISKENENTTIQALRDSMTTLQKGYKTSVEEDDSLLELSTLPPVMRAAVVVRKREKELIASVIQYLDDRRDNLDSLEYQIEEVREWERARKKRLAEIANFKQNAVANAGPKTVVHFEINLGKKGKQNFTVYEGENIKDAAKQFVEYHSLNKKILPKIIASAKKRVRKMGVIEFIAPVILDNGTRVSLLCSKGRISQHQLAHSVLCRI